METNDSLEHSPEFINQDPYSKGWIAVIEVNERKELIKLMNVNDYAALTSQQ